MGVSSALTPLAQLNANDHLKIFVSYVYQSYVQHIKDSGVQDVINFYS